MYTYTVIESSKEQIEKLYKKHCFVVTSSYNYDDEDNVGFVTLHTLTGKMIEYQFRSGKPCFVEFTGFGNIRYDIAYPEGKMFDFLKKWGDKAEKHFWKGGQI